MSVAIGRSADRLGIAVSLACGVHCVATPALLAALPAVGAAFASPWVHAGLIGAVAPLAAYAYWRGVRRTGRFRAATVGGAGLVTVAAAMLVGGEAACGDACCAAEPSRGHLWANLLGSALLVAGHGLNLHDVRSAAGRAAAATCCEAGS